MKMETRMPPLSGNCFSRNSSLLYENLRKLDTSAICYLHHKTGSHLFAKKHLARATAEDVEEMTNDAVLLALQKILNGKYVYQGYSPLTFTLVIADNLLRNFCRKNQFYCTSLEKVDMPQEPEIEAYLTQKDLEQRIEKGLALLSPGCQQIIRLKYFYHLSDEETVKRKLTPYTTVDSLKSKRCACMRKLREALKETDKETSIWCRGEKTG